MGGTLLQKFGARRHTTAEIESYTPDIERLIKTALNVEIRHPKEFLDKPDHGDLDILIGIKDLGDQMVIEKHLEELGYIVSTNGRVTSFLYDELQVDLICVDTRDIDFATDYFSWGDTGNIIGMYATDKGLRVSESGLFIEKEIPNIGIARAYVTFDFDTALLMLGFDPKFYRAGFTSFSETKAFFKSNKEIVPDLLNLNAARRRRIKMRPNQLAFYQDVISGVYGSPTKPTEMVLPRPAITMGNIETFKSVLSKIGTHEISHSDGYFMAATTKEKHLPNILIGKNFDGSLFLVVGTLYRRIESKDELLSSIQFEMKRKLDQAERERLEKALKRQIKEQEQQQ